MLTRLTAQQEVLIPQIRDKWLKIGLSTAPSDWEKAKEGVRLAYQFVKLEHPLFVTVKSPMSSILAYILVKGQVRVQVRDQVRGQVWSQVWDQVGYQVWDQVRNFCYGQHDAELLSFFDFFKTIGIIKNELDGLFLHAQSSGWWLPYKNIAILTDRPNELYQDQQGRLHNPTSMAIKYRDGWGVYAYHGVRVPEKVILHSKHLTVQEIIEEKNVEIRRVMIELYGLSNFLQDARTIKIATDQWGELYRRDISNDEPLVMVKLVNTTPEKDGTHKNYFHRVPPSTQTPHQALAYIYQTDDYNPQIES